MDFLLVVNLFDLFYILKTYVTLHPSEVPRFSRNFGTGGFSSFGLSELSKLTFLVNSQRV